MHCEVGHTVVRGCIRTSRVLTCLKQVPNGAPRFDIKVAEGLAMNMHSDLNSAVIGDQCRRHRTSRP